MTQKELAEIAEEHMDMPFIIGRLVCNLKEKYGPVEQRHRDDMKLCVYWEDKEDFWRCVVFLNEDTELALAQVDMYPDNTVAVECWAPCSVTVDQTNGVLLLNRLKARRVLISGRNFALSMCLDGEQLVDQNAQKVLFSEVVAIETKALS